MAITLYCSLNDVIDRLSQDGVNLRTDDEPPDAAGNILERAAATINEYCLPRYSDVNLAASAWVKHECANVAAAYLCERRGNPIPPGVARAFERLMPSDGRPGVLERIRRGQRNVPDAPERRTSAPVLSQGRIQLWPVPHTVVEPSRSSSRNQPTDYAQRTDQLDVLDYVI